MAAPPDAQASLAFTEARLPGVEAQYKMVKMRLACSRNLLSSRTEKEYARLRAERGNLRILQRLSMQRMGLVTEALSLPSDFSDDEPPPQEPEKKKKKLAVRERAPSPDSDDDDQDDDDPVDRLQSSSAFRDRSSHPVIQEEKLPKPKPSKKPTSRSSRPVPPELRNRN